MPNGVGPKDNSLRGRGVGEGGKPPLLHPLVMVQTVCPIVASPQMKSARIASSSSAPRAPEPCLTPTPGSPRAWHMGQASQWDGWRTGR